MLNEVRVKLYLNDVLCRWQLELHHLTDQPALGGRVEAEGGLVVLSVALSQLSLSLSPHLTQ